MKKQNMKWYSYRKHKKLIFSTFEKKKAKTIFKSIPSELEVVDFHECKLSSWFLPPRHTEYKQYYNFCN